MYTYRNVFPPAYPEEVYAPVPGWGMRPRMAGPAIVGFGAPGETSSIGAGTVALALAAVAGLYFLLATGPTKTVRTPYGSFTTGEAAPSYGEAVEAWHDTGGRGRPTRAFLEGLYGLDEGTL